MVGSTGSPPKRSRGPRDRASMTGVAGRRKRYSRPKGLSVATLVAEAAKRSSPDPVPAATSNSPAYPPRVSHSEGRVSTDRKLCFNHRRIVEPLSDL